MSDRKQKEKKEEKKEAPRKITEEMMQRMREAREQRSMDLFYELCDAEPEEESLEQKVRRMKKELSDNTIR